jgi:hypothetical protein
VEVPVPPFDTPKIPVTSEEAKLIAPVFSSPPTALTTPVPKEDRVVEPRALTVSKEVPEEEARVRIFLVVVAMFWTTSWEVGAEVPMPTLSVEVAL